MSSNNAYGVPGVVITAYQTRTGTAYHAERAAKPGELCTCGRQAIVVYVSPLAGPVGYCGLPGVPRVTPCPFCGSSGPGSTVPHRGPFGDPVKCWAYRLRPAGPVLVTAFDPEVAHVA